MYSAECTLSTLTDGLYLSVLIIAGLWNLQQCCIDGDSDAEVVAKLLPSSLLHTHLHLYDSNLPESLELFMCAHKFAKLQSLVVQPVDSQSLGDGRLC